MWRRTIAVGPFVPTALGALALTAVLTSCNTSRRAAPLPAAASNPGASPSPPVARTYGQPLVPAQVTPLPALLDGAADWKGRTVTLEGVVRKACTRKGCWMEVADGTKEGTPGCRITFKDYGFFVPTDSAGARARAQGTVEVDTLSATAVRHYEEEGAVFAGKRADGTAPEVRIVATGVQLTR